jgi:hypothetical protein
MKTKTQRELNLEYWGRVHDMCDAYNKQHGTNIKTQQCVKYYGNVWDLPIKHPVFDDRNYDLAVAIIEDTPVFVGDKIYHKAHKHCVKIIEGDFDYRYWTLTPPKKKRTFDLNGQQLPCPSEDYDESALELLGEHFYFESLEDRNEVAKAINDLLNNARDKD